MSFFSTPLAEQLLGEQDMRASRRALRFSGHNLPLGLSETVEFRASERGR